MTAAARGSPPDLDPWREGRANPAGLPSEITGREELAAVPRDQSGQDADVDAGLQEVHRAVREHRVGAAGVEAIHFPLIGAVEGTRPRTHRSVGGGTPKDDPGVNGCP